MKIMWSASEWRTWIDRCYKGSSSDYFTLRGTSHETRTSTRWHWTGSMLRAAEGSWFSGTFLHPVMLKSPASRTAFAGVSQGSWKGAAWGRMPVQMRIR